MRSLAGAPGLVCGLNPHQPVVVVTTVRTPVWPAAMQRPEHPLLVADRQSHLHLRRPPARWSRMLLDLKSLICTLHLSCFPVPVATYKSGFTQNVNLNRLSDIEKHLNLDARSQPLIWGGSRKRDGDRRQSLASASYPPVAAATRVFLPPAAGTEGARARMQAESRQRSPAVRRRGCCSAPGGNRTRGLRLERPLLFGSPKRTVDH